MRTLAFLGLLLAFCSFGQLSAGAEEDFLAGEPARGGELGAVGQPLHQAGENGTIHQAIRIYLQEIERIEKQAAQAKEAAQAKLLEALGQPAATPNQAQKNVDGLIGTAMIEGEQSGVAFHYEHGKLFRRELVWDRFHKQVDGRTEFPNLNITLVGYVQVPSDMTVKISHAAGGVNGDHGALYIDDREIGRVGDDLAKAEVYLVPLTAGVHRVRWVLTAGTFQNSQLKFENLETGELLSVFYDQSQRKQTGAADAREGVEVSADPSEWIKGMGPGYWRWRQPIKF